MTTEPTPSPPVGDDSDGSWWSRWSEQALQARAQEQAESEHAKSGEEPGLETRPPPSTPKDQSKDAALETGTAVSSRRRRLPRRWRQLSVRGRVLTALVSLTALALGVAGLTAYGIERTRLDHRIDDSLERSLAEFRELAKNGVDPATGEPFDDARDLLLVALQRIAPGPNESAFSIDAAGEPLRRTFWASTIAPQEDPELLAALPAAFGEDSVVIRRLKTSTADYRYLVAPVVVQGESTAALVLAVDRGAEHAGLAATFRTYARVGAGALVMIGLSGYLIVGQMLHPIRLLRRTAQSITDSDLSARIPVTGDDDLADLTLTVNDMLERLDAAFAGQRRLLDDVGHELRTPLTIVRGHLELMDPSDAAEAESTRALALDELDRMYRLVDDLVTLARADRPDFVRPRTIDVAVLVDDVLAKSRPLGDRRWRIDSLAEGDAWLDPQRLTQALVQLVQNAVKFSQPGSTIALGSTRGGGILELWVRDEGAGIAPEEAESVFERFTRGTSSATTGAEGSGLGLTIVRSIAHGHHGEALLTSSPGRGTTVTLRLPDVVGEQNGRT